jgi:hypothetical protein
MTPATQIFVEVGTKADPSKHRFPVADFAQASAILCNSHQQWRTGNQKTHLKMRIVDASGADVARGSIGGTIWPLGEWFDGMTPLFDNRT